MINGIFAVEETGGLGYRGSLPWAHNKQDMQHFKELTEGHVVVMGRKTFDDPKFPKPLPKRINYVVTNRPINVPGVHVISGNYVNEILKLEQQYPTKEIFVIGGKEILHGTRHILDRVYLTYIKGRYKIDTKIDINKFLTGFRCTDIQPMQTCIMMFYTNELKHGSTRSA